MENVKKPSTMTLAIAVFVGGAIGTGIRASLSLLQSANSSWPWVTFLINIIGAFILGFILEFMALLGPDVGYRKIIRLFIGTGIMGGFTTYSTFILEVDADITSSHFMKGIIYAIVSVAVGLLTAGIGVWCANIFDKYRKHMVISDDLGESDLDAPDAKNDPGNLEMHRQSAQQSKHGEKE